MNPYNHARVFQAQLKKKQDRNTIAIVFFRRGVKAAAKAAQELVSEGFDKMSDLETLIVRRVDENRKPKTESPSATRRDIFVKPQPKQNSSPVEVIADDKTPS